MSFKNQFGISLYPDKASIKQMDDYLKLAKKYNFDLVFINFINILENDNKEVLEHFKNTISLCKKYGFEVTIDVNKSTFDYLETDYKNPNLKFFNDLGIDVLRLDDQFNGLFEATLTFNEYNIKIELNPSTFCEHVSNILSYGANPQNIRALHNFYPQKYSGLDYELFKKYNEKLKKQRIKTGAFITISSHESVGPWDVSENLPTLEIHRDLEIGLQLNHLLSNDYASYIYISTQYANEEDFKSIMKFSTYKKCIPIESFANISENELKVLNFSNHFIRGDLSENILRSTTTRVIFKELNIEPKIYNEKIIPRGSIVIPNNKYNKYKCELQIVKKDILNDGLRNVVGFIPKQYQFLIDEISPWNYFKLV